jgi:nitroreductase
MFPAPPWVSDPAAVDVRGSARIDPRRERIPMHVMDAIRTRRSVRAYLDRPVEEEKVGVILEAARLAPSAANRQEWRFVVVRNPETRTRLAEIAGGQAFVGQAPIVIAACAETDGHVMMCGQPSYPIDVAIALDHMALAAVELGLGTCWIGLFDETKVKKLLGIPEKIRVVELMTLGYPVDPSAIEKWRLPMDQIVRHERW